MQTYLSASLRMASFRLFALLLPLLYGHTAFAQRAPAQFRTQSIEVFGGYQYDQVGYTLGSANGGAVGFDLTQHFLRVPLAVSLELRANLAYGTDVNEHSYVFGPRVEYGFGRFHPYGDFELGLGNIHFSPVFQLEEGYIGDKSAIIAGGGGIDVDLIRNVAAKVDFQAQHWDIDPLHHEVFIPTLVTFGVTYTIPFRPFHKQGDPTYR